MGLGFSISAALEEVEFSQWYDAISALVTHIPDSERPILAEPQRIYADIDKLIMAGHQLSNLQAVAKHSIEDWSIDVNADQARANILLYDDWASRGIDIRADFIDLEDLQGEQGYRSDENYAQNLPPVRFNCASAAFQGKDLGTITANMTRVDEGMKLDQLIIRNQHGRLDATGLWHLKRLKMQTKVTGKLQSGDFGAMLKGFDVDSGIKDSEATF